MVTWSVALHRPTGQRRRLCANMLLGVVGCRAVGACLMLTGHSCCCALPDVENHDGAVMINLVYQPSPFRLRAAACAPSMQASAGQDCLASTALEGCIQGLLNFRPAGTWDPVVVMAYRTEKHRRELQQLPPKGFLGICQVCAWHHTLLDAGVQVDSTPNSLDCITLTGESCCALYSLHRAALSSKGTQQLGSEDMLLLSSLRCARD